MDAHPTVPSLIGAALHGRDGAPVGPVVDLALDARRRPAWLVVRLASGCTLVPAVGLRRVRDGFCVPWLGAEVVAAPCRVASRSLPGADVVAALRRHFAVLSAEAPAGYLRAA